MTTMGNGGPCLVEIDLFLEQDLTIELSTILPTFPVRWNYRCVPSQENLWRCFDQQQVVLV